MKSNYEPYSANNEMIRKGQMQKLLEVNHQRWIDFIVMAVQKINQ